MYVVSRILAKLQAPAAGGIRLARPVRVCLRSQNNKECDRKVPYRKKIELRASTVLVTAVACVEACLEGQDYRVHKMGCLHHFACSYIIETIDGTGHKGVLKAFRASGCMRPISGG